MTPFYISIDVHFFPWGIGDFREMSLEYGELSSSKLNWKILPKWPTLTKIWPPPGWAQSPPVGTEEQQEGAGRPPLASCQVGGQVVIKWVVRWSGLWLVWNVSVLRQKPKRRKSWEIHNPRPRDLLRRTQEIQGKPREDVFPNTSRVLVEYGCRTASPH